MADILPAFPLGIIPFPDEQINLHIFEPRYKQLINECIQKNTTFCIVPIVDKKIKDIGTEMRVKEISHRYTNGEMDIKTEGIGVVNVIEYFQQQTNKLYPAIEYSRQSWIMDETHPEILHFIVQQLKKLYKILDIDISKVPNANKLKVHQVVHKIGLSINQELHLLSLPKESDRLAFLYDHLTAILPIITDIEDMRNKALLNGEFRKLDSL